MPDLGPVVSIVIERCLAVRAGEEVLVIADPPSLAIAGALRDAACDAGAGAVLALMEARASSQLNGHYRAAPSLDLRAAR
jgi:hypothetical protein